jgi:hypothetical protein
MVPIKTVGDITWAGEAICVVAGIIKCDKRKQRIMRSMQKYFVCATTKWPPTI